MGIINIEEIRIEKCYKNYFSKCFNFDFTISEDKLMPILNIEKNIRKNMVLGYLKLLSNQIK